ncbi:MAG: chromate transporter [Clostridiaceae bacterium]|nr:chromate transporter [Clostridiaceae bacterium]
MTQRKWRHIAAIYLFFLKTGLFTFGGGWSILAQIQKHYTDELHLLTEDEVMDIVSVARSLPGIMITNISMAVGYRLGGAAGGCAAVAGVCTAPFFVMCAVTPVYIRVRDSVLVARALVGIRAAVIPIILSSALKLRKSALRDWIGWSIAAVSFVLLLFTNVSSILVVVCGAAAGLAVMEVRQHVS